MSMLAFSGLAILIFAAKFVSFDRTHLSAFGVSVGADASVSVRPLSLPAFNYALIGCDRAISAPIAALQPKIARISIAAACADLARRTIARMPTHGLAHFVAAQAAYHRADPRAAQSHLEKSVAFAGFEGWLAERRLALVVYRMPGDSLQASTTIKSDIATLLTTQSGAELLARYFVRRPASRALIADVAATASARRQTRLTNILRALQAAG
jgi:hypothetical protein